MDLEYNLYIERAENELKLAEIIFKLSKETNIQLDVFRISEPESFFSSVITHSYYCVFYSTKAYLLSKNIKTRPPEEHKKTYKELKEFVEKGIIDEELLKLYEEVLIKAEILLGIFKTEKKKRGKFTYKRLPQANLEPAKQSFENARTFFKHMYNLCKK